jgi:hypothetical protein
MIRAVLATGLLLVGAGASLPFLVNLAPVGAQPTGEQAALTRRLAPAAIVEPAVCRMDGADPLRWSRPVSDLSQDVEAGPCPLQGS